MCSYNFVDWKHNDVHVNCVHDYRVRGIYTVLNVPSMRSILCLRLMHCQNSTTCSCIVHNNILPSCTHAYMHIYCYKNYNCCHWAYCHHVYYYIDVTPLSGYHIGENAHIKEQMITPRCALPFLSNNSIII